MNKEIKGIQIKNREKTVFIHSLLRTFYRIYKKLTELVNESRQVAECQVNYMKLTVFLNVWRSLIFLHSSNEQSEIEIEKYYLQQQENVKSLLKFDKWCENCAVETTKNC